MARVTTSVRSRRSFWSSTRHMAAVRVSSTRAAANGLSEPTGGAASGTDIAESSRVEIITGVRPEHVVEALPGAVEPGHELGRGTEGTDPPPVHERDPVAVLLGLVHVVRGDQHGHPGPGPYRSD